MWYSLVVILRMQFHILSIQILYIYIIIYIYIYVCVCVQTFVDVVYSTYVSNRSVNVRPVFVVFIESFCTRYMLDEGSVL